MQVNNAKWGTSDTWHISPVLTPNSDTAADSNLFFYYGIYAALNDYVDNNIVEYDKPIDDSIAYSAHAAAEKMPLADVEYINYNGVVVGEQKNNCGWFRCATNTTGTGLPYYNSYMLLSRLGTQTTQETIAQAYRWSPNGIRSVSTGGVNQNNYNGALVPIVQFSPKSAFYVIYVELITLNHQTRTTVTLKELSDNLATYASTHYISRAYMCPFTYRGRKANNPAQFADYSATGNRYDGIATINSISFDVGQVLSYYQTLGYGGALPILGAAYTERLDSTHYGARVMKLQSSGLTEQWTPIYSAHLVDRISTIHYGTANQNYMAYIETDISAAIIEKIRKGAAAYGLFFADDDYSALITDTTNEQRWINENMCLGILDDDGLGHGEYTKGIYNITNPIFDYDTSQDSKYNPKKDIDTNTYSVTTGFNTVGNVASTTKAYVVNGAALTGLSGEMWNILNDLVTTPDDMKNLDNLTLDAFLTNNPIDAIVSVKKFPLSSVPHAENLENIYLGKYQTGAAGYALAMQQARYNFEGIPIFPKFGDCFLDYSPYTKMQLYVPFCGTIDIDAADFMGRTLSVEMVVDFITGAVTAYVLANQLVVTSLTGNCGIDIAITGTEQSTVSAALENAILQDKSARGNYALKGSVGGMLTNPIGNITHPTTAIENRFSTKIQTMQANYNLQHVEMPLRQIGNASPLNSWALEFVCRLIIYYPDGECISFNATNEPSLITEKVQAFGAVNGFATVETNTLSSFTGFTQVSDADLTGITATDTEKEMILSLLQSGVYL